MANEVRGRRLLVASGGGVVCVAAGVGFLVGANAGERTDVVELVGGVALPATPTALALYAAVVAAVALGLLFAGVTLASEMESE